MLEKMRSITARWHVATNEGAMARIAFIAWKERVQRTKYDRRFARANMNRWRMSVGGDDLYPCWVEEKNI